MTAEWTLDGFPEHVEAWIDRYGPDPQPRRIVEDWIATLKHDPLPRDSRAMAHPGRDDVEDEGTYWWLRIAGTEHDRTPDGHKVVACGLLIYNADRRLIKCDALDVYPDDEALLMRPSLHPPPRYD